MLFGLLTSYTSRAAVPGLKVSLAVVLAAYRTPGAGTIIYGRRFVVVVSGCEPLDCIRDPETGALRLDRFTETTLPRVPTTTPPEGVKMSSPKKAVLPS